MPPDALVTKSDARAATANVLLANPRGALWLWAVVAVGAALRLMALGRKSFWLDETASVWTAQLPDHLFWSFLWRAEGNMALYYALLHLWLHFGMSEVIVRLLSVLIGVVSIPMMYALGKLLFGESTARLATLFFALNTCAIAVSQEARGYSLLVLGVLVSTYLFVRLGERPSFAITCAYAIVTSVTFYCHYFALLVPAAQAVSLVALPRERRPWRQLAAATAIVALGAVPVLWMIHIQDIGHIAWVEGPSWLELYHLGSYLAAGSGKAVGAVLLLLDLVLVALFLRALATSWHNREHDLARWRYLLIASCLFVPVLISLVVSIVRPIFYHRFLIIGLPAWLLMCAVGVEEIRNRSWRRAAIAAVCGLSLVSAVTLYLRGQEDWRGVTSYLIAQAHPEDRVVYYRDVGYFAVEHYRDWLQGGSVPRPQGIRVDPAGRDWEKKINGAPRVWLVLYRANLDDPVARAIEAKLRSRYNVQQQVPFYAVTVVEYRADR